MAKEELSCRVISLSRRTAQLLLPSGELLPAKMRGKSGDPVVGDMVRCVRDRDDLTIESLLPRKNVLARTYRDVSKELVANVDQLLIVSAVAPLFNTTFIDRVLAVASAQEIPAMLVVNKIDLGIDDTEALYQIYQKLGMPVYLVSAKFTKGLDQLTSVLSSPANEIIALVGISGVGKSTLINDFVPGAKQRTAEVSEYTGHGKQTTTLALAHRYPRAKANELLLVDLPGVQSFGVTHLSPIEVASSFPEFEAARGSCRYGDCLHYKEDECAIKSALDKQEIAQSRYDSYIAMLDEIEAARPY